MNHSQKIKRKIFCYLADYYKSPMIVFDTETTGLDNQKDKIIQFSAIKGLFVQNEIGMYEFKELDQIDLYINPKMALPSKIIEITGITDEMLCDKDYEEVAFEKIKAFMGEEPFIAGYNVPFDIGMVSAMYERQGEEFKFKASYDVCKMARELVTKKDFADAGLEMSYKQENIAKVYDIADGIQFHSAIDDTKVCAKLFEIFLNEYRCEKNSAKKELKIKYIYRENNFQHTRNGVYVCGDICNVFYSDVYHMWYPSAIKYEEAFETLDIDKLEEAVLKRLGLSSVKELKNFNGLKNLDKIVEKEPEQVKDFRIWKKYDKHRVYFTVIVNGEAISEKCFYDFNLKKYFAPGINLISLKKLCDKKIQKLFVS